MGRDAKGWDGIRDGGGVLSRYVDQVFMSGCREASAAGRGGRSEGTQQGRGIACIRGRSFDCVFG